MEEEVALPLSLRAGAWPPPRIEPTSCISTLSPPPPPVELRLPKDLQLQCDELARLFENSAHTLAPKSDLHGLAGRIRSVLDYVKNKDWKSSFNKFVGDDFPEIEFHGKIVNGKKDNISQCIEFLDKLGVIARRDYEIYDLDEKNLFFQGYLHTGNQLRGYNHHKEIVYENSVGYCFTGNVWTNNKNLLNDHDFIDYVGDVASNSRFLYRFCLDASSPHVNSPSEETDFIWYCYKAREVNSKEFLISLSDYNGALACLSYLSDYSLADMMARCLMYDFSSRYAQVWLNVCHEAAIFGLLRSSFSADLDERANAQQALRLMASRGSRQSIIDCALKFGREAQAVAMEFLGYDSRADFLPAKMPKLPAYFMAGAHPAPKLKSSGEPLPPHAVETLARMMLVSTCYLQNSALQEVIEACDGHSLAEFALSAFEVWSRNGAKKDGIGFLFALAYLGDNRAAALIAKAYRHAPPNAATPAIAVLAAMGSSPAIAGLQAIARSSSNARSRLIAQQVLEDVARDRGLTPEMLEDLAVPDPGLDQDSRMFLDFGPRHFLVSLDANLDAILSDESGKVLKALPKPVKADDANMAKAATAKWKELKALLKGHSSDQKKRFEQAMLSRREWDGSTFKEVVAAHPLLSKMIRSLVWATLKDQTLGSTFRIDPEGRYVTIEGAELSLDNETKISLPHPCLFGDKVETWLQIFAENKLTQPFPQLARKWFAAGAEAEKLIRARDGTKVPLGSLRGLKTKGWEFEQGSAGMIWSVYKSVDGGRASIDVEPGWSISGDDYQGFDGNQTVKLDVNGSDPIAYSELVRDFLSLPIVESQ